MNVTRLCRSPGCAFAATNGTAFCHGHAPLDETNARRVRVRRAISLELQRQALGDYYQTRDAKTARFDGTIDLDKLADAIEQAQGREGE
mgnify:CR=1 FL=1